MDPVDTIHHLASNLKSVTIQVFWRMRNIMVHFERKILVHNQNFKSKSQKFKSEPTAKKLKGIFPVGYFANENIIIVVVIICCHQ